MTYYSWVFKSNFDIFKRSIPIENWSGWGYWNSLEDLISAFAASNSIEYFQRNDNDFMLITFKVINNKVISIESIKDNDLILSKIRKFFILK